MPWRAAERLGLSRRQVDRLANRHLNQGARGLVSRKRGQRSNHQLRAGLEERVLTIILERYADFGPKPTARSYSSAWFAIGQGNDQKTDDDLH